MQDELKTIISDLYYKTFKERCNTIEKLPISGSSRTYHRASGKKYTIVATYNTDVKENIAFLTLSKHFKETGLKK